MAQVPASERDIWVTHKKFSAFWLLFIQKYLSMSLGFSVKGKQTPTSPLASQHLGSLMLYKTKTKT